MSEAGQNVYLLTQLLASSMNKIVHMAGRSVNVLSAARLGVAIERHRQENGSLPSELSALVPGFIDAIPNDAFTGEQLDWNHKDTFRYSIEVDEESPRMKWIYDPIQTAVETGNLDALKAFAANGWEITQPNADTPESQVTRRRVIDYSAPETVILTQQNALHHAVHSGSSELVQWLIEQGVDTNGTAEIWPPHDVGELSDNGADVFSLSMFDDTPIQTVLEFAVSEERTGMVKMLLGAGVSPLRETKKEAPITQDLLGMGMPGMQPAEPPTAIELANAEILPLLLAKVPRGKLTQALGEDGGTSALQKVLAKREFGKAKRLINSGANVNYTPTPGIPPDFMTLFGAGMMGMNPFKAKPVSRLDRLSPVALAAWLGDLDLFQFVIQNGGDLAKVEHDKSTTLHHAAANRNGAILRFTLARQPELHTRDESGKSPAACAAQAGRLDNLKQLQQAGAHLDDKAVINAAIRNLNAELVAHLIGNTRKPLAKNPAWESALDLLPEVTHKLMLASFGLGDEQVDSIRKVGALLLDNGLRTETIQKTDDLKRIIKEAQQFAEGMNLFGSGKNPFTPNDGEPAEDPEAE